LFFLIDGFFAIKPARNADLVAKSNLITKLPQKHFFGCFWYKLSDLIALNKAREQQSR
jgi:hypothetical protein